MYQLAHTTLHKLDTQIWKVNKSSMHKYIPCLGGKNSARLINYLTGSRHRNIRRDAGCFIKPMEPCQGNTRARNIDGDEGIEDQVFYRFSESTYASLPSSARRQPPRFFARSRLIYAWRLRADYSTSARLYLVINHLLARSPVPRHCVRSRDRRT